MSLAEALATRQGKGRSGTGCSVGVLLASLDAAESAALQGMLDDFEHFSGAGIERIIRDNGYTVGDQQANKHRRKTCGCSR
jgi:hypothetical protein